MKKKWQSIHLITVSSTNDWLAKRYNEGQQIHNIVVTTQHQTKGKGLGNNQWHSEDGKNLLISLVPDIQIAAPDQFLLNMAVSLAVASVLDQFLPDDKIHIKWPNDIWFEQRKIAGMLITHMIKGNMIDASIVGIGLNVNQLTFPESLPNPVSLRTINEKIYDLNELKQLLLDRLDLRMEMLDDKTKQNLLKKDFLGRLLHYGIWKNYQIHQKSVKAKIIDINHYGQLILEDWTGQKIVCNLKEIVFPLD